MRLNTDECVGKTEGKKVSKCVIGYNTVRTNCFKNVGLLTIVTPINLMKNKESRLNRKQSMPPWNEIFKSH